jgi:hypothetical protein
MGLLKHTDMSGEQVWDAKISGAPSIQWLLKNEARERKIRDSICKATEKKFEKILAIGEHAGIRVLVSEAQFAIFIPEILVNSYDVNVNHYLQVLEHDCFIADKTWCFIKIDIDPHKIEKKGDIAEFASCDPLVRLYRVYKFIDKNFVNNQQIHPESGYFTIGSFKRSPNCPRPFRLRLGGQFKIEF